MRSIRALLGLAGALFLAFSVELRALPKKPIGLDVLPSLLELQAAPGETIERSVTLTNPGEEALDVSAEAADWTMSEKGEIRFDVAGSNPRSCAGWIRVTPSAIRVPPMGQATVSVRVGAPVDLDGTRWAVVFFRLPDAAGYHEGRPADLVARVGLTVYVTGSGTEREWLDLTDLTATGAPEILLRASFDNGGNTAVRVKMTWQIRAASGSVVRTNAATVVCLPGSRREAVDRVPDLPPGAYKVSGMARWGNRRWKVRECVLEVPAKPSKAARLS
ncbi:MAG: hypothetical protein M3167_11040 [Acidobacteriota bacterium]|nr:hypothetical protein [Acidobacteriota bacterium]